MCYTDPFEILILLELMIAGYHFIMSIFTFAITRLYTPV
jgi:Na+/H+ antiporter NhaB